MAIDINDWNRLSSSEKDEVINFLRGNCKIDCEYPASSTSTSAGGYPISEGCTSGGHPMKYGEEYRVYLTNIQGIPPFLNFELKEREIESAAP